MTSTAHALITPSIQHRQHRQRERKSLDSTENIIMDLNIVQHKRPVARQNKFGYHIPNKSENTNTTEIQWGPFRHSNT